MFVFGWFIPAAKPAKKPIWVYFTSNCCQYRLCSRHNPSNQNIFRIKSLISGQKWINNVGRDFVFHPCLEILFENSFFAFFYVAKYLKITIVSEMTLGLILVRPRAKITPDLNSVCKNASENHWVNWVFPNVWNCEHPTL